MSAPNDGGPAFPLESRIDDMVILNPGMALRDYFAAKAMLGDIVYQGLEGREALHIAGMAYEMADAMLKAREAK